MKIKLPYHQWLYLLTRGDKILIIILLLISIMSFYAVSKLKAEGRFVIIEVNGFERYRLLLTSNVEIKVRGVIGDTFVEIKQGQARIIRSDCPSKVCIKTGSISRVGEMIVCVPNKVVIRISGKVENNFDVITE